MPGITPYAVPISGSTAAPDCSQSINALTESANTFVATPINYPSSGVLLWQLVIKLGVAGCSTQFASSYGFALTATDASSPLNSTTILNLTTDSSGSTSLVSFSSTT